MGFGDIAPVFHHTNTPRIPTLQRVVPAGAIAVAIA